MKSLAVVNPKLLSVWRCLEWPVEMLKQATQEDPMAHKLATQASLVG